MEILIVDDEPQVAEVLARSLAREGHSAKIAHSGEEALQILGRSEPDALFLDVSMPGMNGLDVLSQVKRMPRMSSRRSSASAPSTSSRSPRRSRTTSRRCGVSTPPGLERNPFDGTAPMW